MFWLHNQVFCVMMYLRFNKKGGMTVKKRIEEIRKHEELSRAAFGERLGVSGDVINNLERGRVEAKEHIIKLICNVYNVNEHWLKTGEGEMFNPMSVNEELSAFLGDLIVDQSESFKKRLITALTKLRPEQWDLLEEIIDTVNDMKKE